MNPLRLDRRHGGDADPGILDFSANLNPLGPPPRALEAYRACADAILRYPAANAGALATRMARWLDVPRAWVLPGNGTTHLLYLIARVLKPRAPFVVIPTFSEIANALLVANCAPRAIARSRADGFAPGADAIGGALAEGADAIFVGRPNSPVGWMLDFAQAEAIARRCADRRCWCVFDEAFIEFVSGAESACRLIERFPTVIVLRSLTKSFAIPGLRVGCVVADGKVAAQMRDAIEPWSVNAVAERVALACLEEPQWCERACALIAGERARITRGLAAIPDFTVFPSVANFLMFEVGAEPAPGSFARHMLTRGIAVRDLTTLPGCGPGLYRVAIRLREENERMLSAAADYRREP